VKLTPHPF